jgi:hypothetical protein
MGEIDSPIGKTTFKSQPMKTWTVEDVTDQDFEIPPNAREQGAPGPEVYENLTPEQANQLRRDFATRTAAGGAGETGVRGGIPGKRRLEILLGIGRGKKDVSLQTPEGRFTFSLRTLKGREQREVATLAETLKRVKSSEGAYVLSPTSVYQLRTMALKHSLYAIDGIDIDMVLGQANQSYEDRISFREAFLDELDEDVLSYLFSAYESLVVEHTSKYNFSSEEDMKEVAEEVKKSGAGR